MNTKNVKIYFGATEADKAYFGAAQVWSKIPPILLYATSSDSLRRYLPGQTDPNLNVSLGPSSSRVAVDENTGDIITTGTLVNSLTTYKWDKDGNELWSRNYAQTTWGVAVDSDSSIYIVGQLVSSTYNVRKYNSSGTVLWSLRAPNNSGGPIRGVAIRNNGDIIVVGTRAEIFSTSGFFNIVIVNSSGTILSHVDFLNFPSTSNSNLLTCVCVDSNNNFIVGSSTLADSADIKKYNANASIAWRFIHGGSVNGVAVDSNNDVYMGGARVSNLTTRKLNGSTGVEIWSRDHGGTVEAVATDKEDKVYTVGVRNTNIGGVNRSIRVYDSSGTLLTSIDQGVTATGVAVQPSTLRQWQ
jgi:hypothetical protein